MSDDSVMRSYAERLDAFRRSDQERDQLVADLIKSLGDITVRHAELKDDYENEMVSRRRWQSKCSQAEQDLALSKQTSAANGFCIAVIDGDGAIFNNSLYANGKGGGAEAAHQLLTGLRNHLFELYPESNVSDWSIIVQVVLNLQGLAFKLYNCGIVQSPNDLLAFGQAFGLAQPLFSFVDVGSGKERADHKIKETLRVYLPVAQCKHVFFGPCHDNGYLPVLEPYRLDAKFASRLTLIETRPAEPGFDELGLRKLRLENVFRSTDLAAKAAAAVSPTPATSLRPPPGISAANATPFTPAAPRATSPFSSTGTTSSAANTSSWATVGKSGVKLENVSIAPAKSAPKRPHILLNRYDERVDLELPRADQKAEARFAERTNAKGNLCNNYYLTGKCNAGTYCDYNHREKLTPGELLVLRHKGRTRRCVKRAACEDPDCTFGHHCKYNKDCTFDVCYFADTHDMDIQPFKRQFEDGTEELMSNPSKAKGW